MAQENRLHLKFCMHSAAESGENRHPQIVMKELGITYQEATPQSLHDSWWFWNCENIPTPLPAYVTPLKVDPIEAIGHGLTTQLAVEILSKHNEEDKFSGPFYRHDGVLILFKNGEPWKEVANVG